MVWVPQWIAPSVSSKMKIKKIKQTIVFTDHIFRNTRLRLSNNSPSAVRLYKQYILRNISDNLNIEPFINPIKSIKVSGNP